MKFITTISDKDVFPEKTIPEVRDWITRQTVKVVLLNEDNKIALVTNPIHNCFLLPGGGIDDGEEVYVAADRECREEVGYSAILIESLGVIEEYRARDGKRYETHGVLARTREKIAEDLRTEEEKENNITAGWYSTEEVLDLFKKQNKLLELGKIDFYNTGFNILRDAVFVREAIEKDLLS